MITGAAIGIIGTAAQVEATLLRNENGAPDSYDPATCQFPIFLYHYTSSASTESVESEISSRV
jgi:hypothetical protein